MKKFVILALCLVLTAAMTVGCGCTNRKMDETSAPTVLPTNEEVWDTTAPTTRATTEATTIPTVTADDGSATGETADRGNGPLEDTTGATEGAAEGRARSMIPGPK